jgi:hypothetical protein
MATLVASVSMAPPYEKERLQRKEIELGRPTTDPWVRPIYLNERAEAAGDVRAVLGDREALTIECEVKRAAPNVIIDPTDCDAVAQWKAQVVRAEVVARRTAIAHELYADGVALAVSDLDRAAITI